MDSVIMTTPGNSMRLRSRLRSAANTICARNSKTRSSVGLTSKNHHHHLRAGAVSVRNLVNKQHHQAVNKYGNVNEKHSHRCHVPSSFENGNDTKLKLPFGFVNTGTITSRYKLDNEKSTTCITFQLEVYNAWCGRLGDVTRIPSDSVQALFNDMQLYPSKKQVLDMLEYAKQCSRRSSSNFLTFGEFCVFAGELRRENRSKLHQQHYRTNLVQKSADPKSLNQYEVFLGGSCNPTTWRADIAIPTLVQFGITYYNPQVATWGPELMAAEHDAKESADVLLFVVDSQTRCVAGMLEVAHLVAKKRCIVLVVHPFARGQAIMGETLSLQELTDLSEGQSSLLTLVRNQGVTVHTNLSTALQCTISLLRGSDSIAASIADRKLSEKLIKVREVFDSMDTNSTGVLSLSDVSFAYYQLTGSHLRISDLHAIMNMSHEHRDGESRLNDVRINFEQFCAVVAEFSTPGGCSTITNDTYTDGANRFTNTTYWKLVMLRTQQLLRIYVIRPIVQIIDLVNQPVHRHSANNNTSYDFKQRLFNATNGLPSSYKRYDVYLGGSCVKRTTWRHNIAIPLLKRYGITYYNPSLHENITDNCSVTNGDMNDNSETFIYNESSDLLNDMKVMNDSRIVLFVITNETRSITSMILAAYYIAFRKNVVLCVQHLPPENCIIDSNLVTKQAIKDYNRARAYLSDLAKHENIPTFEDVTEAIECAVKLVKNTQR